MGADDIDLDAKLAAAELAREVGSTDGTDGTDATGGTDAIGGTDGTAGVDGLGGSSDVARVSDAARVDGARELVSGLATGALDPVAAQQLLIEQVLAEQLPDLAPERLQRLRLELAKLLDGDPTLAALLRPR